MKKTTPHINPKNPSGATEHSNTMPLAHHFKNIVDSFEQSIIIIDCTLQILYANKRANINALKILEFSIDESFNIWNLLIPKFRDEVYQQIQKAFAGEVITITHVITNNVNEEIPTETSYVPFYDEAGVVSCIMLKDIELYYQQDNDHTLLLDEVLSTPAIKDQTDMICRIHPSGIILFINESYCKLFQKSCDDLIGKNLFDLISENEKEKLWAQISRFNTEMPLLSYNQQVQSPNQNINWLSFTNRGIFNNQGKLVEIQIVARDITEQKRLKGELNKTNRKLEAIFNAIPDQKFLFDKNGNIVQCFEQLETTLFTTTFDYYAGKSISDVFNDDLAHRITNDIVVCLITKEIYIQEYHIPFNNQTLYYEVRFVPLEEEQVLCISRNITSRKDAEEITQQSTELYRKLIAASTDGITIIGMNGRITFVSEKTVSMVGCSSETEIVGSYPQDWFVASEKERVLEHLRIVMQGNERHSTRYKMVKKTGEVFVAEINTTFLSAQDGSISGIISFIRDVTYRKKLEDDLIEAKEKAEESDRLKTAFLANISHEIRTPMNGIIGFSKLMIDPSNTPEATQEYVNIINSSCDQLLAIINDVIEISTIEAGPVTIKRDKVDISAMLSDLKILFDRIAVLNNIELNIQLDPVFKQPIIYTDGQKVKQIFCNLLSNALKFSNDSNVKYGFSVKENQIEFFVKDEGIGISPENHEIIFERFRKVDKGPKKIYGGTGLGLAISKSLVEKLGGKIWVESQEGLGSQFYFNLPSEGIHTSAPQTITSNFKLSPNCWLGNKILIAEDEEYNYVLLCAMLKKTGISIIRAKNGVEAFSLALSNQIDIVLMDLKMPLMGGLNATESIRQFDKTLPIIAISAYAFQQDKKKALAAGCNDFITKPVSREELCDLLNNYLQPKDQNINLNS